jgi:hypothetical protein
LVGTTQEHAFEMVQAHCSTTADQPGYLRSVLKKVERQFLNAFESSNRTLLILKVTGLSFRQPGAQPNARLELQQNHQACHRKSTEKHRPVACVETKKAAVRHHTRKRHHTREHVSLSECELLDAHFQPPRRYCKVSAQTVLVGPEFQPATPECRLRGGGA